jgi:2-polyprenyl-6-methoxyphenol hydroxylase-like FAD-dependent oxidoreductase
MSPGADGCTVAGSRRVNWVLYVNTSAAELTRVTTGISGRRYQAFVPAREVPGDIKRQLFSLSDAALPPLPARLIRCSEPFLQPVYDVISHRMRKDRMFLIGDAAGTARPHTASGTSKSAADAILLASALDGWAADDPLPEKPLRDWERDRLLDLRMIAPAGLRSAATSGLGTLNSPMVWDQALR